LRTFFLFYLLTLLLRNPLLALLIVGALVYFGDARYRGRYFNPAELYNRRNAIAELRRTVAVNDHDVAAHNDLGRLLVQQGRPAEALPHLEKAIARMDESPETHYFYGLALLATGREQEGVEHIERALERNRQFRYGEPQTALARHFLERGDAECARRWASEAVKVNTSNVEGWTLLAEAASRLGDPAEARRAFEQAREAFSLLPRYLKLPNRRHLARAKRGLRRLGRA